MKKKDIIDRAKAIVKQAYVELNDLSKQVEEEQSMEDKLMEKLSTIKNDTGSMKRGLIG